MPPTEHKLEGAVRRGTKRGIAIIEHMVNGPLRRERRRRRLAALVLDEWERGFTAWQAELERFYLRERSACPGAGDSSDDTAD